MIRRVLPYLKKEWVDSFSNFLDTYDYFQEGIVNQVEEKIRNYTGRKHALCVNSASNAIFMCLYVIGKPEGEVIMSNYGYPSTFKACKMLNMIPIGIDIKENTLSMNPRELERVITPWTTAVAHIGNNGVIGSDIEKIKSMCEENGLIFLEDSAPSMLQEFNGNRAGCFGDLSIYSFSATKPITCGEGGVILTDDDELFKKLDTLRHTPKYSNKEPSLNFCLSPFLAAYLLPQLDDDYIQEIIMLREKIHEIYKGFGLKIFEEEGITNRYGAVMYLSDKAERIHEKFDLFKIEHRYRHYTLYEEGIELPISKKVRENIIDLPSHYFLTEKEIKSICTLIKRVEDE